MVCQFQRPEWRDQPPATLTTGGRITVAEVNGEIQLLLASWEQTKENTGSLLNQKMDKSEISEMDLFDRIQLEGVLAVCKISKSQSEAGRKLHSVT